MSSEAMEVDDGAPEFTLAEVMELEKLYKKNREMTICQEFCQEIATNFSSSRHRSGKPSIAREQVQTWFQIKRTSLEAEVNVRPCANEVVLENKREKEPTKSASEAAAELQGLRFEARSAKDYCWFDVASFLSYKVNYSGEHFARVRFSGFDNKEDEWVNVKSAVRERSIPLEPSECKKINVGDLVLCFRESEQAALYCDAYVVHVRRKVHGSSSCTCVFVVRYDYDNAQGEVSWDKLCYRPETQQAQFLPSSSSYGVFEAKDLKEETMMGMFSF